MSVVNKKDMAIARLMVIAGNIDDDDLMIESLITFTRMIIGRSKNIPVNNIVLFDNNGGTYCVNADENDTIKKIVEGANV